MARTVWLAAIAGGLLALGLPHDQAWAQYGVQPGIQLPQYGRIYGGNYGAGYSQRPGFGQSQFGQSQSGQPQFGQPQFGRSYPRQQGLGNPGAGAPRPNLGYGQTGRAALAPTGQLPLGGGGRSGFGVPARRNYVPYRPSRPTTSPYLELQRRDTAVLSNVQAFYQPRLQLNAQLAAQQSALQNLNSNFQQLQRATAPTGAGGGFFNQGGYFGNQWGYFGLGGR